EDLVVYTGSRELGESGKGPRPKNLECVDHRPGSEGVPVGRLRLRRPLWAVPTRPKLVFCLLRYGTVGQGAGPALDVRQHIVLVAARITQVVVLCIASFVCSAPP